MDMDYRSRILAIFELVVCEFSYNYILLKV